MSSISSFSSNSFFNFSRFSSLLSLLWDPCPPRLFLWLLLLLFGELSSIRIRIKRYTYLRPSRRGCLPGRWLDSPGATHHYSLCLVLFLSTLTLYRGLVAASLAWRGRRKVEPKASQWVPLSLIHWRVSKGVKMESVTGNANHRFSGCFNNLFWVLQVTPWVPSCN
jgi:hypothetical protein